MTSIISNTVIIYKMLITSEDIQSVVKDPVFKDKTEAPETGNRWRDNCVKSL